MTLRRTDGDGLAGTLRHVGYRLAHAHGRNACLRRHVEAVAAKRCVAGIGRSLVDDVSRCDAEIARSVERRAFVGQRFVGDDIDVAAGGDRADPGGAGIKRAHGVAAGDLQAGVCAVGVGFGDVTDLGRGLALSGLLGVVGCGDVDIIPGDIDTAGTACDRRTLDVRIALAGDDVDLVAAHLAAGVANGAGPGVRIVDHQPGEERGAGGGRVGRAGGQGCGGRVGAGLFVGKKADLAALALAGAGQRQRFDIDVAILAIKRRGALVRGDHRAAKLDVVFRVQPHIAGCGHRTGQRRLRGGGGFGDVVAEAGRVINHRVAARIQNQRCDIDVPPGHQGRGAARSDRATVDVDVPGCLHAQAGRGIDAAGLAGHGGVIGAVADAPRGRRIAYAAFERLNSHLAARDDAAGIDDVAARHDHQLVAGRDRTADVDETVAGDAHVLRHDSSGVVGVGTGGTT